MKNKHAQNVQATSVTNALSPDHEKGSPVQLNSKHKKKPKKQYL